MLQQSQGKNMAKDLADMCDIHTCAHTPCGLNLKINSSLLRGNMASMICTEQAIGLGILWESESRPLVT